MEHSPRYIVLFAAAVCGVCSILVSTAAVSLKDLQARNRALDVQSKVLDLAGVSGVDDFSPDEIEASYAERIEPRIIDLETGEYVADIDASDWNQQKRMADPETSIAAPSNLARVRRLPKQSVVYHVKAEQGGAEAVILPIQGQGLWGTLYGYLAVADDGNTIEGITFYKHKETPGLGGEIDNPRWRALWPGRKIYDADGEVAIRVKKGIAGSVEDDPFEVDGLSGATITSRGVTNTLVFWFGDQGFGPYMAQLRKSGGGH